MFCASLTRYIAFRMESRCPIVTIPNDLRPSRSTTHNESPCILWAIGDKTLNQLTFTLGVPFICASYWGYPSPLNHSWTSDSSQSRMCLLVARTPRSMVGAEEEAVRHDYCQLSKNQHSHHMSKSWTTHGQMHGENRPKTPAQIGLPHPFPPFMETTRTTFPPGRGL